MCDVQILVVFVLRNVTMNSSFVDEMHVDGTFSLFYVGTERLQSTRRG